MSASIIYHCARTGCEARADVDVETYDVQTATIDGAKPDGWGWDLANGGLDEVLHCPEHRTDEEAW